MPLQPLTFPEWLTPPAPRKNHIHTSSIYRLYYEPSAHINTPTHTHVQAVKQRHGDRKILDQSSRPPVHTSLPDSHHKHPSVWQWLRLRTESPAAHNATLKPVVTHYFTASSLLWSPLPPLLVLSCSLRMPDNWQLHFSSVLRQRVERHNRQSSNYGKITTGLVFQVPVWIMNPAAEK